MDEVKSLDDEERSFTVITHGGSYTIDNVESVAPLVDMIKSVIEDPDEDTLDLRPFDISCDPKPVLQCMKRIAVGTPVYKSCMKRLTNKRKKNPKLELEDVVVQPFTPIVTQLKQATHPSLLKSFKKTMTLSDLMNHLSFANYIGAHVARRVIALLIAYTIRQQQELIQKKKTTFEEMYKMFTGKPFVPMDHEKHLRKQMGDETFDFITDLH